MSRFQPAAVSVADYDIALDPALALEFRVLASTAPVARIGEFETPVVNSGVMEVSPAGAALLDAEPSDLHMVVTDLINSDAPLVVTLNVKDHDGGYTSAVANFTPPAWVENDSFDYQAGFAVDLVTTNGKRVKQIVGITSVVGGKRGTRLRIIKLPSLLSFKRVGFCTNRDFSTKSRPGEHIADGHDGSASVKRGRSDPGELNISQKFGTFGDGLARIGGRRCTIMLELYKDDVVLTDRIVMANYIGKVKPSAGDGSDHATSVMEGIYEHLAVFVAK